MQRVPVQLDDPAAVEYVPEPQIVQVVAPLEDQELSVAFRDQTSDDDPE